MAKSTSSTELAALYREVAPAVHRRAAALLRDEAEAWDVLQEVFGKLAEYPDAFRGEALPLHYCYRITTHLCLNRLRAARVRQRAAPDLLPDEAYEPAAADARNLLLALLDQLDDRDAQIATLHFFDQLTQEEIAVVMGHTRKTIGLALQRVRALAHSLAQPPKPDGHHG